MQDEQSLVRRAQQQDQEAFAQLYETYFDKIYRYITLKIGDRIEAEDMTQQVFLKAMTSISSYQWKNVPFSAWLFRIAHNQVVDRYRKVSRQPTSSLMEDIAPCEDPDGNPQRTVEQKLDIERLIIASRKLTPAQREVIALRFSSELPVAEVARLMGKSEGAVKALQHSAIVALRKLLIVAENYD